jgi:hypothetical protein
MSAIRYGADFATPPTRSTKSIPYQNVICRTPRCRLPRFREDAYPLQAAPVLRTGYLVGVREFSAVAAVKANSASVSLACLISIKMDVRRPVYRDDEREIPYRIVLEASACNVAFCPHLFGGCHGKGSHQ